jgi:hypothetical protein
MVCDVIENCRCYAFKGSKEQFCAVRKGPSVLPCPTDCCAGGCPDDGSREPFRYIDRPDYFAIDKRFFMFILWLIVTVATIFFFRNLKIKQVRKI